MLRTLLATRIESDAAENSIMQTITIAVSSILVAAGLITAPGLINNARDTNATTDLANIAYGEEYALANDGHYKTLPALLDTTSASETTNGKVTGFQLILSDKTTNGLVKVCDDPQSWVARMTSSSGVTFYRSSDSATTSSKLSDITVDASCIDMTDFEVTKDTVSTPTPTPTQDPSNNPTDPSTGPSTPATDPNITVATPVLTASATSSALTLSIANPNSDTVATSNDVWRRTSGSGADFNLLSNLTLPVNGSVVDDAAQVGVNYDYYVVANAKGASSPASSTVTAGIPQANPYAKFTITNRASGSNVWKGIDSSSDGTKLFAVTAGKQLSYSTNSGATWALKTGNTAKSYQDVATSADGTKVAVAVNGPGYIWTSSDSGTTLTQRSAAGNQSWSALDMSADGKVIVAGYNSSTDITKSGWAISTDGGVTWKFNTSIYQNWDSIKVSADGKTIVGIGRDERSDEGSLVISTDGGTTMKSLGYDFWEGVSISADGTKVIANGDSGVYRITDGKTLQKITTLPAATSDQSGYLDSAQDADGSVISIVAYRTGGNALITSTDSGQTWTTRATGAYTGLMTISADGTKMAGTLTSSTIYTGVYTSN
jgi:hypothetical protein